MRANAIKLTMVVARGTAARTKAKKIRKKHQECARQQKEEMQKAEVEGYFARFDLDKNGTLDKDEFPELLKALFGEDAVTIGIDSVVARLVKNCEKQGGITKENVIRAINKYGAFVKEQAAAAHARENVFDMFDKNGDGVISKDEMLPILKACAKQVKGVPEGEVDMGDVDAVFAAADTDQSGSIDPEEFKVALATWKESMAAVNWVQLEQDALEMELQARWKSTACSLL